MEIVVLVLIGLALLIPYAFIGVAIGRYAWRLQPDLSCRHSDDLLDGHTFSVRNSQTVAGQTYRLSGGRNCSCTFFSVWIGCLWPFGIFYVVAMKLGMFGYKSVGEPLFSTALHIGDVAADRKIKRTALAALERPKSPAEIAAMEEYAFGLFNEEKEGSK